jgi:hypothetical protein
MDTHTQLIFDEQSNSYSCKAVLGEFDLEISANCDGEKEDVSKRIEAISTEWESVWQIALSDAFAILAKHGFIESSDRDRFAASTKKPFGIYIADNADSSFFCINIEFPDLLEDERYISWTRGFAGGEATTEIGSLV